MRPFLTVVTRACRRPKMLAQNIESVLSQTDPDLEQLFLPDLDRQGIQAADKRLGNASPHILGEYVFILDDDCRLIDPDFVKVLKEHAGPAILFVRSKRPPGPPMGTTIVPTPNVWEGIPKHGTTNCLCYVIRADLWRKHIHHYGIKPWGGDWWFLEAVLGEQPTRTWIDRIVAEAQQLGRGKTFEVGHTNWWKRTIDTYHIKRGKELWYIAPWEGIRDRCDSVQDQEGCDCATGDDSF